MKSHLVLACALALPAIANAADHGPVFGYATPVNSQREISFDTGIFGRQGSSGTQLSTGSGFGYGITPHLTVSAFLPATFNSGALPESRMIAGSEWSAGASWRFQHSVTSVGKRIESTGSLNLVVPGPQPDSGLLGHPPSSPGRCRLRGHRPCFAKPVRVAGWWLHALCAGVARPTARHDFVERRIRLPPG